ncbi:MAG TPA: hypothetical protein PLY93_15020, partial [Turneriella sp.]|nr:hypothetical protein [Turneriella sp.]
NVTHPVCALSTPSGRSAIAVIRATGTGVFNALEHFFHPKAKRGVHALDARTTYYGTLREGGEFIDDVLLIKF